LEPFELHERNLGMELALHWSSFQTASGKNAFRHWVLPGSTRNNYLWGQNGAALYQDLL
jgi:hypothetical protein